MNSLRLKIFLLFCGLVLLIEAVMLTTIYLSMREQVDRSIDQQLEVGREVFLAQFESRRQHLTVYSSVIARDYGLVSTLHDDPRSLQVALNNHRNRVGADLAIITDLDGDILADTQRPEAAGQTFEPAGDISPGMQGNRFLRHDQQTYQLAVAPLLAPNPVGRLYLGFIVDDRLAAHFEAITSLQVSFMSVGDDASVPIASTMPNDRLERLVDLAGEVIGRRGLATIDGEQWASLAVPLERRSDQGMVALLQRSRDKALAAYGSWWQHIAEVSVLILLVGFLGAWLAARGVARPLGLLVEQAREVARGNYEDRISLDFRGRGGEIGELIDAFEQMQSAIAEREASIRYSAYHDSLTGLINRHRLEQLIDQAIEAGSGAQVRCAVLVMNLNRFKDINDTLGHHAGDRLLRDVARRLQQALGNAGSIARLAGDEFAILLEDVSVTAIRETLESLHAALSEPFDAEDLTVHIGSAIGVAVFPEHGHDAATLLQHADVARLAAREKHARYEIYSGSQDRYSLLRVSLLGEMQAAMDSGDMMLYFQPKLDLRRGGVSEVEALLRWRHPEYGMIPPHEFISMVENTGNIHMLTVWVIETALQQALRWARDGRPIGVAVNISAHDLLNPGLIGTIRTNLEQTRTPPERLRLEVTESAVVEDEEIVLDSLRQLHRLGVGLSIDDYGTGYSSLAQLKRLPVDELKIDKSFVQDMERDSDDETIVRSTIELGHLMGMTVCAEGVESAAALDMLRGFGCEKAQGFHIARPLPAGRVEEWLWEAAAAGSGTRSSG